MPEKIVKERVSSIHLIILTIHTFFCTILFFEVVALDWEKWALPILVGSMVFCWWLHITQYLPADIRIWVYEGVQMVTFFYFGSHEEGFYSLTPIMVLLMMVYCMMGVIGFIHFGFIVYVVTLAYNVFLTESRFNLTDPIFITRIFLHFAIIVIVTEICRRIIRFRKLDETEYAQQINELSELNNRTEDFLTNVSHELRTPINAVTGITSVLLHSASDTKTKMGLLSIRAAGHRLFDQIGDILDYTEINTNRLVISEDNYMIATLISDLISDINEGDMRNNNTLIFDVDSSVPAVLSGDSRKLKKILRHLIDNAMKFTQQGGACVRIEAMKKSYGINLFIRISDTGIGIRDEEMSRITEKFYQSDSGRSRATGGLGLGMSIVYGLTTAMDGFMQIDNTAERGTSVQVSIPQKVVDDTPCMEISQRDTLKICCYLQPSRYEVPQVWTYYNELISHLARQLKTPILRAADFEDVRRIAQRNDITHIFMGWEEYEEQSSYFNQMAKECTVVVACDEGMAPTEGSRVIPLAKPISPFSIVHILSQESERVVSSDGEPEGKLLCPGARMLVVDDEVMNLVVVRGIFKDYKIALETASGGAEAIDICKEEDFDLIFLDHMMPEMDGVETMKRLRELNPDRPMNIVALTANAVSGAREMFLREGFDEFLSKPIETKELERIMRKLLPASLLVYEKLPERTGRMKVVPEWDQVEDVTLDAKVDALIASGSLSGAGYDLCERDSRFFMELLTEFIKDSGNMIGRLKKFRNRNHRGDYLATAHSIGDTAVLIGATRLEKIAFKAEKTDSHEDYEDLIEYMAELSDEFAEVIERVDVPPAVSRGVDRELDAELSTLSGYLFSYEQEKAESFVENLLLAHKGEEPLTTKLIEIASDISAFDMKAALEKTDVLSGKRQGEA